MCSSSNHSVPYDPIHSERISRYDLMCETTKLIAQRGTCLRARVGCVIELSGRILTWGYNGSLPGEVHCLEAGCLIEDNHCVRCIHAEANAICWAARKGIAIEGATLFVYGWEGGSCHRCKKLAASAGIKEIVEVPR